MIFESSQGWGPSGIYLKEWAIFFNRNHDSLSPKKIWVIILNLSLVFWNESILVLIGNMVGKFVGCELVWENVKNQRWEWEQIQVDLKDRHMDEIEPVWGGFNWLQKVDY